MIATIRGKITHIAPSHIIVETFGIGYLVFVPTRLLTQMHQGEEIFLYTYQHVREDALSLYGFLSLADQMIFEKCIQISGIGPKLAMTILSQHSAQEIHQGIVNQDVALFQSVSGVGKKTAQRIIVELQEQISDTLLFFEDPAPSSQDVIHALEGLGYSLREARELAAGVDNMLPIEQQITEALKKSLSR